MNDQLIMENYLLILKSTVEVFVHGTLESSNPNVREILKHSLDQIILSQDKTFNELKKMGAYQVNNVNPSVILATYNKLNT